MRALCLSRASGRMFPALGSKQQLPVTGTPARVTAHGGLPVPSPVCADGVTRPTPNSVQGHDLVLGKKYMQANNLKTGTQKNNSNVGVGKAHLVRLLSVL